MQTLLIIFIAVTAVAVVIQMGVLVALYATVKKTSARVDSLTREVESRAIPTLDAVQAIVVGSRSKVETIITNLAETTTTLRGQVERLDVTVSDIMDRTRLQVIRADELVSRTLDRVEETTEIVQHTVISPIRQFSGIVQGLSVGLSAFFGKSRRKDQHHVSQDEMFI